MQIYYWVGDREVRVASESPISLCNSLSHLGGKHHLAGPSIANPGNRKKEKPSKAAS